MAMSLPLSPVSSSSPLSTSTSTSLNINNNNNDGTSSQDQIAIQTAPPNSNPKSTNTPSIPTSSPTQIKRKQSRRANTAERRATHNAVERQRRETLNGRFLVRSPSITHKKKKN